MGVIISAFTVERNHGEAVAWPSSKAEAIDYAAWYAASHGESMYVIEGAGCVAVVDPPATS